jgi:hypothetical protein
VTWLGRGSIDSDLGHEIPEVLANAVQVNFRESKVYWQYCAYERRYTSLASNHAGSRRNEFKNEGLEIER